MSPPSSLCPILMAKCTGSVSLPQTLLTSAEHTNCLSQVTECETDGVTKYQNPVSRCLVTQRRCRAGRSVKAPTPWPAGPGLPGRGVCVHLHTNRHTHAVGVGPKTFKTGNNLKHETLKNHSPAMLCGCWLPTSPSADTPVCPRAGGWQNGLPRMLSPRTSRAS